MIRCCCYRKGTNFQANHNPRCTPPAGGVVVVVATAKVQIFKQITTVRLQFRQFGRCCCYRKGTNFQANHNCFLVLYCFILLLLLPQRYKFSSKSQQNNIHYSMNLVVVATAKVQIFKQITTPSRALTATLSLLLLPQRYKFSSKSQHFLLKAIALNRCCCYRKGTNFQANHNSRHTPCACGGLLLLPQRYKFSSKSQLKAHSMRVWRVVVATAKVQIFKQITTPYWCSVSNMKLLLLPQRYKFSSKSQHKSRGFTSRQGCCCYRKGTNFQANHNLLDAYLHTRMLLLLPQRYKFSSKSQLLLKGE